MMNGHEISVFSLIISENQWTTYFELQFQNEVADFARLNNENTVMLLAHCRESEPLSRMLLLEYTSNGTLYEPLHCYGASEKTREYEPNSRPSIEKCQA
ncbi:probable LRR receptor-like serine/threonine-protein kinase At1g63430 [Dioscorea cayenensis subsp. rotundata]|uniref:Probable LRR receptor-like serine/threonine-protein kinase At1g63430 n=1 Tax=Dioscorea cayennensis subsp. rotundata TaxID=55577 RepID=A0AB40CQQ5_DIOCR|nr:probable LRR receptor-like serine/threonine-protein kinase At1g63430 [Dioscorea cayenensis subsp. rotundata]